MQIFTMDIEQDMAAALAFAGLLSRYSLTGEFYITGDMLTKYPAAVRALAKRHIICGHGYHHERFAELSLSQQQAVVEKTVALFKLHRIPIKGWRFPYLSFTAESLVIIAGQGLFDSSLHRRRILGPFYYKKGIHLLPKHLREMPWSATDLQDTLFYQKEGRLLTHCYQFSHFRAALESYLAMRTSESSSAAIPSVSRSSARSP